MQIKFSKQQLESIKADAMTECAAGSWVSTNDALMAYLSKHFVAASQIQCLWKPDQLITILLMVNIRERLNSPLPNGWFGNGVIEVPIRIPLGELLECTVSQLSIRIRAEIQRGSHTSKIEHEVGRLDRFVNGGSNATIEMPYFLFTNWCGLAVHETQWGTSKSKMMHTVMLASQEGILVPEVDGGVQCPASQHPPAILDRIESGLQDCTVVRQTINAETEPHTLTN